MRETRRRFVLALFAAATCIPLPAASLFAQKRRPFPDPPEPPRKRILPTLHRKPRVPSPQGKLCRKMNGNFAPA